MNPKVADPHVCDCTQGAGVGAADVGDVCRESVTDEEAGDAP